MTKTATKDNYSTLLFITTRQGNPGFLYYARQTSRTRLDLYYTRVISNPNNCLYIMNKPKRIIQQLLIIGVVVIGMYMLVSYTWPAPPAVSGLAFIFAGLALWIPHCPLMRLLFRD